MTLELLLFLAIFCHASSIKAVDAVQATASADSPKSSRLHVRISSEAYSSLTTTLRAATMAPASFTDGETITLVSQVDAFLGATRPLGRVARKQQRGAEGPHLRRANEGNESDDNQLNEDDYRVDKCETGDGPNEIVRGLARRISRARIPHGTKEYDNEDDSVVVLADTKVRRDRRRKARAGRNYGDGPKIWDEWGKWTSCSASCGAGKLTRWRHCIGGGCSMGNLRLPGPKIWDQWGRWSCCSVTCGVGKYTRWRHCVAGNCVSGEKEAQIKSCELKRCS